ncbi:GTP pyrophosphokinase [Kordia sp. SMS9]|uniref:HD domain-containing protein n=1 Tax=Kordia sp. SMS9 TaxID=2282170 RepID=UPI000E0DB48D|nr:HD domain-containing protein [Kordia sp. SMS9]AXG72121.1 GTP pyrophosphokinase [Kordia sp. SMS9]
MSTLSIDEKARLYASEKHKAVNHYYDQYPYVFHLQMVVSAAEKFIHLIPEKDRQNVLAGCWVHDVIEDARETYNDVKKALNKDIAELAYALTNNKGRTRQERAGKQYYVGIRNTPYAAFIKLCDRIANVTHSKNTGSRMLKVYRKENPAFVEKLYDEKYVEVIQYLEKLVKE